MAVGVVSVPYAIDSKLVASPARVQKALAESVAVYLELIGRWLTNKAGTDCVAMVLPVIRVECDRQGRRSTGGDLRRAGIRVDGRWPGMPQGFVNRVVEERQPQYTLLRLDPQGSFLRPEALGQVFGHRLAEALEIPPMRLAIEGAVEVVHGFTEGGMPGEETILKILGVGDAQDSSD